MWWFIGVLKHIFGFGDEERREIPRNQSQRDHDYHRVLSVDYLTISVNQSSFDRSTSSSAIHRNQHENSLRSFSYPKREIDNYSVPIRNGVKSSNSDADFANSNKNTIVASISTLPSSQKPVSVGKESNPLNKNLLLQSSSVDVLQRNKGNQITGQKFLNKELSASSQSSQSSSDFAFSLHCQKPPSVTTNPIAPSISKSNKHACQPKGANLSSPNNRVPQSNFPDRVTNKLTDQKLRIQVQSSSRLLPSSSTLETENSVSSLKKDPLPFSVIHSTKLPSISTKPTLSLAPSSSLSPKKKTKYVWVEKSASSTYAFPDHIKSSIEKDIVPEVLKMPLSISTYKDYFHSLLYAEDCYLEKWDGFEMKNVTLELHEAEIYMKKVKAKRFNEADERDEKIFVAFEIDKIPERRPFLLSRDFVSVQPSSKKTKAFQGLIYRVVKSNLVLAEFGEDFHSEHYPACKYDVKFSFNRVCLKRAHQAIAAASDLLDRNFLFPGFALTHDHEFPSTQLNSMYQNDAIAVRQISRLLQGAPPYLVEGLTSVVDRKRLSRTGVVITEAVFRICRNSPSNKILLCAPLNNTCDVITRALKKELADSNIFRANAAFREVDGVPVDILPSCLYEQEMDFFACPSLEELKKYKVIISTYMSSFRLYDKGIKAGHFSHIFLVDNSSVTEPETMVPLANFANAETAIAVTGTQRNRSGWIRSRIARQNGLMTSYFERLCESWLYKNLHPSTILRLED